MHAANVYFIQLVLKIKYVEFVDNSIFYKETYECERFSASRLTKELPAKKLENTNIGRLSAKVTNNRFNRTHCDD